MLNTPNRCRYPSTLRYLYLNIRASAFSPILPCAFVLHVLRHVTIHDLAPLLCTFDSRVQMHTSVLLDLCMLFLLMTSRVDRVVDITTLFLMVSVRGVLRGAIERGKPIIRKWYHGMLGMLQ